MFLCNRCRLTKLKLIKNLNLLTTQSRYVATKSHAKKEKPASLYSNTILLPKISFPLHHEPKQELVTQKDKTFTELYLRQQLDESRSEAFVLHNGPPYANGSPHLGHSILKDIICRYKFQQGKKIEFTPGWDCHGLPIELKAVEAGSTKDPLEIRKAAQEFARKTIDVQRKSFERWGLFTDWTKPYLTFDRQYIINQLRSFYEIYEKGLIYKDHLPVYWSICHETALAEAELQYNDAHISKSVYVRFKIANSDQEDLYALIWTTTPWTLIANQAIAFAPGKQYAAVKIPNHHGLYLVATDMIAEVEKTFGTQLTIVKQYESDQLASLKYIHPTKQKECPLLEGHHVTMSKGTGLVHSAPNHGKQDYSFAMKHKLALEPCLVDEKGQFTDMAGQKLAGKAVLENGTEEILKIWNNEILFTEDYQHSYPYDWRSKKPVIIRASQQWFMNIENIKDQCIESLKEVPFYPESLKKYLISQIEERPPWCISRQRSWGVPIPVFYQQSDKDLSKPIINNQSLSHTLELFKSKGPDAWWSEPIESLAHSSLHKQQPLVRGSDILDIWFDSGISWNNVLTGNKVADLYLEGYDQIRGWFQSSLITSVALRGRAPYKSVYVHGFTVDEHGKKMSKSEGNVIDPRDLVNGKKAKGSKSIDAYGADVLRWWVFSNGSTHSLIRFGLDNMDGSRDAVKKIRGTLRFLLGGINEFEPSKGIAFNDLHIADKLILSRLSFICESLEKHLNEYQFDELAYKLFRFISDDLSAFYFMATKHRLYCFEKDSVERTSCQTTYYHILNALTQYLAPILPHMLHEFYQYYPSVLRNDRTVFEQPWLRANAEWQSAKLEKAAQLIYDINSSINKVVKNIKMPDHDLTFILADEEQLNLLKMFQNEDSSSDSALCEIFQAARVNLSNDQSSTDKALIASVPINLQSDENRLNIGTVQIYEAKDFLCPRCRRKVSSTPNQPCTLCLNVLAMQYKD